MSSNKQPPNNPGHQVSIPLVQQPTTIIVTQPSNDVPRHYSALRCLPHHSTVSTCSNCAKLVSTRVVHRSNCMTHCFAFCLCMSLCWPCICFPYCNNNCKTTSHYCIYCDSYLGDSSNP